MATVQNRAPKKKAWTKAFLESLRATGIPSRACELASVPRSTVYSARSTDPEFAAAWLDALEDACDALELEARRRGLEGVEEPVYGRGTTATGAPGTVQVGTIRRYSDTLLIFLLKGNRPGKFRENHTHEVSGPAGGPIRISAEQLTDDQLAAIASGGSPETLVSPPSA